MISRATACLLAATCLLAGCAPRNATVASAFPQAASAAPWVLSGAVWSGTFTQATPALGDDADDWHQFQPTQVWLAVYHHERDPGRTLTVRAFAFDSAQTARRAFQHFRPVDATEFRAGTEGCWTRIGVLFVRDRLVFDIFGSEPTWRNEIQAAMLAGYIQNAMPAGLPSAPQ